jgi:hypothetical protein
MTDHFIVPKGGHIITASPFGQHIFVCFDRDVARDFYIINNIARPPSFMAEITEDSKGCFVTDSHEDTNFALLGWFDQNDITLWHEALHAAIFMLAYHGVPFDVEEHEILCYLQGDLVEQIRDCFAADDAEV